MSREELDGRRIRIYQLVNLLIRHIQYLPEPFKSDVKASIMREFETRVRKGKVMKAGGL